MWTRENSCLHCWLRNRNQPRLHLEEVLKKWPDFEEQLLCQLQLFFCSLPLPFQDPSPFALFPL